MHETEESIFSTSGKQMLKNRATEHRNGQKINKEEKQEWKENNT